MPQLNLMPWLFNFALAWFFLLLVMTIILSSNSPRTNYITVAPTPNTETSNNWLWT